MGRQRQATGSSPSKSSRMNTTLPRTALAAIVAGLVLAGAPATTTATLPPASTWAGVVRGDLGPAGSADPVVAAHLALERMAPVLDVDAGRFGFDHVTQSAVGTHVRGREVRAGVPVDGTSATVHIVDGRIWQVEARASDLPGAPTANPVPASVARTVALASLGLTDADHVAESRSLTRLGDRLVDVWRIDVLSLIGVAATVDVAAADGKVVRVGDDRRFDDGQARVFDPNPIVSARDNTLRQPGVDLLGVDTDLPSQDLDDERVTLPIREVDPDALANGRLLGPWVDVRAPAPLPAGSEGPDYDFGREDPRFEALMAYAHLDRLQRYIQDDLGLTGVNDEPQLVIAIPVQGFDNSFYQPGNDLMLLGAGGVDDGEDAEVIVHEYGHAVQDAQVPGWGDHPEGGAMGEGFGDFLAAAYYARSISGGFQDECVMDWDATSYSNDDPPCLRRTDGDKHWPEDREGQVHDDGEIWSQYLWALRSRMVAADQASDMDRVTLETRRSDRMLRLLLTSHTFLSPTATFADAVAALESAATALGEQDVIPAIRDEAERIGFEVY